MTRLAILLFLTLAAPSLAQAQAGGYFSEGEKQLEYREAGSRSTNERIVVASIFGAGLLAAGLGTYYVLDSQSLSDELSASQVHTGKAWSTTLEAKREDALRSGTIATVAYGLAGSLVVAGVVAYIVTAPSEKQGYQDWQTRSYVIPGEGGFIAGQGWTF